MLHARHQDVCLITLKEDKIVLIQMIPYHRRWIIRNVIRSSSPSRIHLYSPSPFFYFCSLGKPP